MAKNGGNQSALARRDEEERQKRIREGTTRVNSIFDGQFNDGFFGGQRQAFLNYATPQLQDQYRDAQRELSYSLARSGNLNSSARGDLAGRLQKLYTQNQQQLADQALSHETQSRTAVEDARSNLITTLNATGDAEGAASSALARSSALSQPAAYSPVGQLFAGFTNLLNIPAAQAQSAAAGQGSYVSPGAALFNKFGKTTVSR